MLYSSVLNVVIDSMYLFKGIYAHLQLYLPIQPKDHKVQSDGGQKHEASAEQVQNSGNNYSDKQRPAKNNLETSSLSLCFCFVLVLFRYVFALRLTAAIRTKN